MYSRSLHPFTFFALLIALAQITVIPARAGAAPADTPSGRPDSSRRTEKMSEAADAEARAADLAEKLDRQREALRKMIGPDHAGVDTSVDKLEADEVRLEVDKAGLTARRDALADAVARLTADADKRARATSAEAIQQVETLALTRAAKVDRLEALKKAGQASDAEVAAATAEHQATEAQLHALKAAAPQIAVDYETIAGVNRQLVDTSVTLAETIARLDFVRARLRSINEARGLLDQILDMERAQQRAKTDAATYRQQAEE